VVGWAMQTHLRSELVLQALEMAYAQRRPGEVIHHSDQGTQYTSIAFGTRCREMGECSASIRNGTWRQLELPVHPTAFGCASALAFAPRFCFEAASAR